MTIKELKDLWIGDLVFVKDLNTNARWDGLISSDRSRIIFRNKKMVVSNDAISAAILEDNKDLRLIQLEEELSTQDIPLNLKNTSRLDHIDLHIEKLNPQLKNGIPQHIINHQLSKCKAFIEKSIAHKRYSITIIHGKGKGALRAEVINLVQSFKEVSHFETINQNGALVLYFNRI